MKIEKLTPEQEVRMVEVRDYWLKTGLSTDRADRSLTEKTISEMYALIGKKTPRFIWMDSPFGVMVSISLAKKCMQTGANLGANLWENLWANLRANLGANLRANLGANLWANLGENLGANLGENLGENLRANLGANLGANLRENLWANLRENLGENLRANLGANLGENLGENLRANLRANLRENLRANLRENLGANLWENLWANLWENLWANLGELYNSNYFWGSLESYWVGYYKFGNEIGVSYSKEDFAKLELWSKLAHSCFWWWPYENVCFISDRPKAIHRNSRNQLHNPNGLAIEFHDGYGMYCLNGIRMKALDVTTPAEKLDPKEIMKRENVDERRELIRKVGIERMLSVMKSKTLDTKGDYSLLQIELSDTIKDSRFLKMLNPSIGIWHLEGVARECKTVQDALNWRAGDIKKDWVPSHLT